MADPGEDFAEYMDHLAAAEERAARDERMYAEHEIWRQTTWGGWVVRQIQATGRHFGPFLRKVSIMMNDDESLGTRLFVFVLRLLILLFGILFLYAIGRLVNFLIGGDIIKEEEIVIVHEYETEEEAAKARAAATRGKTSRQRTKEE